MSDSPWVDFEVIRPWKGDVDALPKVLGSFLIIFVISVLGSISVRFYRARKQILNLRDQGLPVAPSWNWAFGNLLLLAKLSSEMPRGIHKTLMFGEILRRYFPNQGCCYLDLWPVSYPFLIIMSPELAAQATQTVSQIAVERPPQLPVFFKPVAGGLNLFDLPGKEWKHWRTIFNKGFNTEHLSSLIPGMVEETELYCSLLRERATRGDVFLLDPITLRFTMSLIGRTVLNASLGAQTGYNALADGMLSQISWMMPNREINPLEQLNLFRYAVQWWNGRKMDAYAGAELDKRYEELRRSKASAKPRSVMDLVLHTYMTEITKESPGEGMRAKLDPEFRSFAIRQIRLFLFVGHDSLSSTICYSMYLLEQNPEALKTLGDEHNKAFGHHDSAASKILSDPTILNGLPYTAAVIKETLRLFPPGSGIRQGLEGTDLVGPDGTHYPTGNTLIWIMHVAMHREPNYWVESESFIPERWIVEPGHRLYPRKEAWRAFEWGPRNCIGQSLAMMELKLVLAFIAREFDFAPAYDEIDVRRPAKEVKTYRGERAYLMERGAAHPADLMPCRVTLAKK